MEAHSSQSEQTAHSGRECNSPVQTLLLTGILAEGKCFMSCPSTEGASAQDQHRAETPPLSPRSAFRLEVLMLSTIDRCLTAKDVLLEQPLYWSSAESKQDDGDSAQVYEKFCGKRKRTAEEHLDTVSCNIDWVGNPQSTCPGQVIDSFLDAENGLDASPTSAIWNEWNESEEMDIKIKVDAKHAVNSAELPHVPELQLEAQGGDEEIKDERSMQVESMGTTVIQDVPRETDKDVAESE
eukprot:761892-Hanusia_phi.AAC.1